MGRKDSEKEKKSSKRRKKERSPSSSSSTSSSSSVSLSSLDEETKQELMKKLKKLKKKEKRKKKEKKALKKLKNKPKDEALLSEKEVEVASSSKSCERESLVEKSKNYTPMTKEEWEKQQNMLRRVYDEETGRMRLIKGTGEIVEECVSRKRHLAINKQATKGDGEYFQKILSQQTK